MLAKYQIIDGDSFELALTTGHTLRADWVVAGATQSQTVVAADGVATLIALVVGCYYLATREDATRAWCRIGTLEVETLVDTTREQLKTELANANAYLADAPTAEELIRFEVTDPSGTASKRMMISQVTRWRGVLEVRLADLDRTAQGLPPVRFS